MEYASHVQSLAQAHGVNIEIARPGYSGRAWPKARKIKIPEVKTAVTYALSMHELGHVLGKQSGNKLNNEKQVKNRYDQYYPIHQPPSPIQH